LEQLGILSLSASAELDKSSPRFVKVFYTTNLKNSNLIDLIDLIDLIEINNLEKLITKSKYFDDFNCTNFVSAGFLILSQRGFRK
jgi:hypothetical protein